MAVTFPTRVGDHSDNPLPIARLAARVFWISSLGDVPCRVFLDGRYLITTRRRYFDVAFAEGQSRTLEVFDDANTRPTSGASPFVDLVWLAVSGAVRYRVERLVLAAWVTIREVHSTGKTRERFSTEALAGSVTAHQHRVTAIDAAGNESVATVHSLVITKRPTPPLVVLTRDPGSKKVTFAEAA